MQSLQTNRLQLRLLQPTDFKAIHQLALEKQTIEDFQYLSKTYEDTLKWIEPAVTDQSAWTWTVWKDQSIIGLVEIVLRPEFTKSRESTCRTGFFIQHREQRKGYATEMLRAVIKYVFEQTNYNRIEAGVTAKNEASCNLLEKLGFVKEKEVQADWSWYGETLDSYYYALTKNKI